MSERPVPPPTDAFTELVVDYIAHDEVLTEATRLVWALGHDPAPLGDLIHTWVRDRDPHQHEPSLYRDLAVLALGMVNWPHVAQTILSDGSALDEADHAAVTCLPSMTSGNVSANS